LPGAFVSLTCKFCAVNLNKYFTMNEDKK